MHVEVIARRQNQGECGGKIVEIDQDGDEDNQDNLPCYQYHV